MSHSTVAGSTQVHSMMNSRMQNYNVDGSKQNNYIVGSGLSGVPDKRKRGKSSGSYQP